MKKIILLFSVLSLISCQEVIDLKLDSVQKQLVIDAAIDWEKGKTGNEQCVILSYTTDYYSTEVPQRASGAVVSVKTYDNKTFTFIEKNAGEYVCDNFQPELNKDYLLSIAFEGKHYTSKARMREVPTLSESNITQIENGGLLKNEKQLKLAFEVLSTDELNSFVIYIITPKGKGMYAFDDKFFNGKITFNIIGSNIAEEFKTGDKVEIVLYRVSGQYQQIANLMKRVSVQGNQGGGGPPMFSIPARVNGNITNEGNPKENPLGAFRVAQYSKLVYVVK